jgi:hypothetical protein
MILDLASGVQYSMRLATYLLAIPVVFIAQLQCPSQTKKNSPSNITRDFLIDPNRPYVYLKLDHVGQGPQLSEDEPKTRVWLKFVNNSRVSIRIDAFGLPDEWPKNEVGVVHEVVPDPADGLVEEHGLVEVVTPDEEQQTLATSESETMPGGYGGDVFSSIQILPGKSVLFSLPINHLGRQKTKGKNWHIEIPFDFDLPQGKGPRNPMIGGEPHMVLLFSISDLPENLGGETQELK